jgi:hypothetical protein
MQYFTLTGSFLGKWGKEGSGPGEFKDPYGIGRGPLNVYYVADSENDRVQYFTATGSYLGQFGKKGTGNGEFDNPGSVVGNTKSWRLYVGDDGNSRVQYFKYTNPAVFPESLGKVKALFK